MSSLMKSTYEVFKAMTKKSHPCIVKLQKTRDEKTLKAFRERWKKKIAHIQWKSEWQTFQKQPRKLQANRGMPSKF